MSERQMCDCIVVSAGGQIASDTGMHKLTCTKIVDSGGVGTRSVIELGCGQGPA